MSEMWNENLKIHFDSVKTHKMGLAINTVFPMEEESKNLMQSYIEQFYDKFLGVVSTGRKMTKEQVHEVAQGRIWLGSTAKDLGLVDVLGDLNKAIEICAAKADIKEYSLTNYPRVKDNIMQEIIKGISQQSEVEAKIMNNKYIKQLKPVMDVINDETQIGQAQAKMPYLVEFR